MSFFDVFLNVLAVLGIIALGAFIIVFLSDLLISVIDNSNGIFFKRKKTNNTPREDYSRPKMLKNAPEEEYEQITYQAPQQPVVQELKREEVKQQEVVVTPVRARAQEQGFDGIDYEKAREEEQLLARSKAPSKQQVTAEQEKNAERLRIIEQRRREYEEAQKAKEVVVEEEAEVDEEDINSIIAEVSKESVKEIEKEAKLRAEQEAQEKLAKAEQLAQEKLAKAEQEAEEKLAKAEKETQEKLEKARLEAQQEAERKLQEQASQEKQKLSDEIEELKRQLAEANSQVVSLTKQIEETPERETIVAGALSREEIEEKLVVLRQRLKENEKELSINKKDYMPLRRVNATLESDKKKLRRKEAIVAKQKVLLYGVNNYVDIDEEKAKKLAEDLDLLEGLRLSVQHCEEVMAANKDRFPILEKTNKILKKNVEDIKSDIAELEAELAELDDADDTTDTVDVDVDADVAVEAQPVEEQPVVEEVAAEEPVAEAVVEEETAKEPAKKAKKIIIDDDDDDIDIDSIINEIANNNK